MLHKEAAIAVMVAVMLGASSLLGGFSALPALATHDPDATEVTTKQFTREDEEVTNIGAIEITAKKSILRASGTITIEVLQNGSSIASANLGTSGISTTYSTHEVEFDAQVEGSFEVLVEYMGTGSVQANNIQIINGTETAEEDEETGSGDEGDNTSQSAAEEELENIVKTKTIPLEDESLDVKTVEFIAKKSVLRASGTITVAIVQDDKVLDTDSMRTNGLSTTYSDLEASFDVEVTGEFDVVIMYEGTGSLQANSIVVPGQTTTAEDDGDDTPGPSGTVLLTVNAIDEAGNEITGMAIGIYQGTEATGDPDFGGFTSETFELEAGDYVVAVSDFGNNAFLRWDDSTQDRTREATLTEDETFTAVYSTDVISPPPDNTDNTTPPDNTEDSTTPPPSVGSGTITVYAHRIPSEHWGPTFTGANAQMFFVVYNSTLDIVASGFYDENGNTVTGLNDGETYFVSPTDCNTCHDDPHDVVFRHWENGSTERQRPVTTGMSVTAFYEFVPH